MGSNRSKLTYDHLPKGTVMGMSFHLKNLAEEIRLGHSSLEVEVFKGELSDEEVVSYLTLLNKGEEKRGLSLILEDKENIESMSRDENFEHENLWIQLKETSGFQPGALSRLLSKVVSLKNKTGMLHCIQNEYLAKYLEVHHSLQSFALNLENAPMATDFFRKFLLSSATSFEFNILTNPTHTDCWDCRYVVCDDARKVKMGHQDGVENEEMKVDDVESEDESEDDEDDDVGYSLFDEGTENLTLDPQNSFEGIPLMFPRATSKPAADAMKKVFLIKCI